MVTTRRLGKIAADVLGYTPRPDGGMQDIYRPPTSIKLGKDKLQPEVTADSESVTITGMNYNVTFYLYFSRSGGMVFNGIRVKGWPDDDTIARVLDRWDIRKLTDSYVEKLTFLTEQPGFRTPLVQKTPQKRVYASEVE